MSSSPDDPVKKLARAVARLNDLVASGEVDRDLRRLMLLDPVRRGNRVVLSRDAHVLETLARLGRPIPVSRMAPAMVKSVPRLARAGLLVTRGATVEITPRGRALGVARSRQHACIKRELDGMRRGWTP